MKYYLDVPFKDLSRIKGKDIFLGKKKINPALLVNMTGLEGQELSEALKGLNSETSRAVISVKNSKEAKAVSEVAEGIDVPLTLVLTKLTTEVLPVLESLHRSRKGFVASYRVDDVVVGDKKLSAICSKVPGLSITAPKGPLMTLGDIRSGVVGHETEFAELYEPSEQNGGLDITLATEGISLKDSKVKVTAAKKASTSRPKAKAKPRPRKGKGIFVSTVSR